MPRPSSPLQKAEKHQPSATIDVARWTGRSALSIATTTPRPHYATAGSYRTRMSHMRLASFRAS
jgi:hypothetical protein